MLFSSPVIAALFAHRSTLIYISKTRLERLHPISLFRLQSVTELHTKSMDAAEAARFREAITAQGQLLSQLTN